MTLRACRHFALSVAASLFVASATFAAEVKVMISGGFSAAYEELGHQWERETGNTLTTIKGPSMGATPQAIPNRIDLVRSSIAMAVRKGDPKPDISTVDALKRTLLAAKSIAYSDSASGVYIEKELIPRLGIAEQLRGKARAIPAEPVGKVVARGDAQIGFQQLSELKPIEGIDIVGYLPADAQKVTIFSGGISSTAKQPEAAKALLDYLSSAKARPTIAKTGLEPM